MPAEWEAVPTVSSLLLRRPLGESESGFYTIGIKCALCLAKLCCPVVAASCPVLGDRPNG